MTIAQNPASSVAQDAKSALIESISAAIVRSLAPHLGASQSTDDAAQLAALVPKIKPIVQGLFDRIDAAGNAGQPDSSAVTASRVASSVVGALVMATVPNAAAAGMLDALLAELPNVVATIQQHFAPEQVLDKTGDGIVHDGGEKALDGNS